MESLPVFLSFILIFGTQLSLGHPVEENGAESKHFFTSASNTVTSVNGYHVSIYHTNSNGDCISTLTVLGNGIHKIIDYACKMQPQYVINLNKTLLVGDEYFSDTPGTLVRIVGDKCEKEVFQEQNSKYTSETAPLDDKECEKYKLKISILKEQQEKWNEWYQNKQREAQFQLQQLQNSLTALQQHIFGGGFLYPFPTFGK